VVVSPVKSEAIRAGITPLQPASLTDPGFRSAFEKLRADIGVVAAYGRILPQDLLDAPSNGMINVHASVLPRYRGAAPVRRAVIAGDAETGVTIMRVVKALDAGPTIAVERRPIAPDETSVEVERDLAQMGARLLVTCVDQIAAGTVVEQPQDDDAATYAPRLTKKEGDVDWARRAPELHNLIRGLHPWPHAYTFWRTRRLILRRSAPVTVSHGQPAGTVLSAEGDNLIVAAGEGAVRLLEVQVEGKRPMTARDFLAGHNVAPGERLSSAS
jgi:methionyl-tRNA formyltransferase